MIKNENSLIKYLEAINNKQPIIINYGKGYFTDNDIKDYATWDYEKQAYTDETGIWNNELLIEIAKGEVEGMRLEL